MSNQKKVELNYDTKISLDYNDILKIFAATKMVKTLDIPQLTGFAVEIEETLESKLKDPAK